MWRCPNNILIQVGFICLFVLNALCEDAPTIRTDYGMVKGKMMTTRKNRKFHAYLGIPYAAPPVGSLRFAPPTPPVRWTGTRSCMKDSNICMQRNIYTHQDEIVGNEDCLYLNVYSPYVLRQDGFTSNFPRSPVMIWFHGGGWVSGAGTSTWYGPKYLLDYDVVLVTVNYRLGPLGFLSMEDEECPGNLGLKDQTFAMKWVQDNILQFGGNVKRVTIFGESAGGASVHLHMASPLSRGLFHRAISQSGNFYNPWVLESNGSAKAKALRLAENLSCTGDSKNIIDCLRKIDGKSIIATDRIFQIFDYCPMIPFKAVIEPKSNTSFLTEDPVLTLERGGLADVPWMTGVVEAEGALKVASLYGLKKHLLKELNDNFTGIAPISLFYKEKYKVNKPHILNEITNTIREFYYGYSDIDESEEARYGTIDMYSDAWFTHGTHQAIKALLKFGYKSPFYYYYFTYRGTSSFSQIFGDHKKDYGTTHADELLYLFPITEQLFKDRKTDDNDINMIDLMTSLWYNFANNGDPSYETVDWKPVKTIYAPEYMHISYAESTVMKTNLLWQRMAFWDAITERMNRFGHADLPKDEF